MSNLNLDFSKTSALFPRHPAHGDEDSCLRSRSSFLPTPRDTLAVAQNVLGSGECDHDITCPLETWRPLEPSEIMHEDWFPPGVP